MSVKVYNELEKMVEVRRNEIYDAIVHYQLKIQLVVGVLNWKWEGNGDLQRDLVDLEERSFPVLKRAADDLIAVEIKFVFLVVVYCTTDAYLITV